MGFKSKASKEELERRRELYGDGLVAGKASVYVGPSQYQHVFEYTSGFRARLARLKVSKTYKTEREAALRIDMALIKNGEEPVNIIKKK